MKLTEEQIRGIKDGIVEGAESQGIKLSERDQLIIEVSIMTTLDVVDTITSLSKGE